MFAVLFRVRARSGVIARGYIAPDTIARAAVIAPVAGDLSRGT
jgi:hypothetical protein